MVCKLQISLLIAVLLLAGCAPAPLAATPSQPVATSPAIIPTTPPSIISTTISTAPPVAAGDPAAPTVTLAQNNQFIILQPGQRFLLNLGDSSRWTVTIDQPAVVGRVAGITVVKGAQGVYQALQSGQATLDAVGLPVCVPSQGACSQLAIDFSLKITVSGAGGQPTASNP